jgi:hypothetical protein
MHPTGLTSGNHTSLSALSSSRQMPARRSVQRRSPRIYAILNTKPINDLRDIQVLKDLKTDGGLDSLELRDVQVLDSW